jgi:hypothetical protein
MYFTILIGDFSLNRGLTIAYASLLLSASKFAFLRLDGIVECQKSERGRLLLIYGRSRAVPNQPLSEADAKNKRGN